MWGYFVVIWLSILSLVAYADLNTLIHVHVVWRHGDRTPSVLMPTDYANGIKTWPDGLGEITREGLEQQYHLGELIRKRYDGFLSKHYNPFEIYIRSSDYNRTLTSAQANLIAMYPPQEDELFVKTLRWRPIPVHTIPKEMDKELFDEAPCPNAVVEEARVYSSQVIRQIEDENAALLQYIGEKSGYAPGGALRLRDVWRVFDPLWAEFNHPSDHTIPNWINQTVRDSIFKLYHLSSSFLYGSPLLKRLRAGPLFGAVLARMENVAYGRVDPREKLYAYSAHDTAVAALLSGFELTPATFPKYATAAFTELHKINNTFIVKVLYKNETFEDAVYELEIPSCPSPCSLTKLRRISVDVIPNNWEEECGIYSVEYVHLFLYFGFASIGISIILLIAAARNLKSRTIAADCNVESQSQYKLLDNHLEQDNEEC